MRFEGILAAMVCLLACGPSGSTGTGGMGGAASCPNDLPASCPPGAPGYKATIAPLLEAWCVGCHSPGGDASERPLVTWAQVSVLKSGVLDQVYACKMPTPPVRFPLKERTELLAWLVCGSPND